MLYFAAIFGAAIGSFINVLILRSCSGESVLWPPSSCPHCSRRIAWYDNIPVLSWLILRARCRHCRGPISAQYPLVELICAAIFAASFAAFGSSLEPENLLAAALCGVMSCLIFALCMIDFRLFAVPPFLLFCALFCAIWLDFLLFGQLEMALACAGCAVVFKAFCELLINMYARACSKKFNSRQTGEICEQNGGENGAQILQFSAESEGFFNALLAVFALIIAAAYFGCGAQILGEREASSAAEFAKQIADALGAAGGEISASAGGAASGAAASGAAGAAAGAAAEQGCVFAHAQNLINAIKSAGALKTAFIATGAAYLLISSLCAALINPLFAALKIRRKTAQAPCGQSAVTGKKSSSDAAADTADDASLQNEQIHPSDATTQSSTATTRARIEIFGAADIEMLAIMALFLPSFAAVFAAIFAASVLMCALSLCLRVLGVPASQAAPAPGAMPFLPFLALGLLALLAYPELAQLFDFAGEF